MKTTFRLFMLLASFSFVRVAESAPSAPRPNILLIIVDQQQAEMWVVAGNRYVKTPMMDSLAATGHGFR